MNANTTLPLLYRANVVCDLYQRPDERPQLIKETMHGLVLAMNEGDAVDRVKSELPTRMNAAGYDVTVHAVYVVRQESGAMLDTPAPSFILSNVR